MKSVAEVPLVDIAEGIFDGPHATPPESEDGPIFLRLDNITPEGRLDLTDLRYINQADFPKWTRRVKPEPGDVVFSYEATLHRYVEIPEGFHGCLGRRLALIRPNRSKIEPRYLLYYFLSPRWRSVAGTAVINGATVDRISLTLVRNLPVRLPALEQQRQIIDVLSAYDDLIENNRRRMALLEESARLLYQEWFVRLRFPGHERTRLVEGVPDAWERVLLGDRVVLNYGKGLKADERIDGPFPVFGSSGIVGFHERPLVAGPGIIVGRKGNVGSVHWSSKDYYPIDTVYYIDADSSDLYLYYALRNMHFISTDVAVPGLNRDFAYSRPLLFPTDTMRRQFLDAVVPLRQQIENLEAMNDKLRAARDLLLPRLMSGEIAI
jgi:type I restriction enzyme S subunit